MKEAQHLADMHSQKYLNLKIDEYADKAQALEQAGYILKAASARNRMCIYENAEEIVSARAARKARAAS